MQPLPPLYVLSRANLPLDEFPLIVPPSFLSSFRPFFFSLALFDFSSSRFILYLSNSILGTDFVIYDAPLMVCLIVSSLCETPPTFLLSSPSLVLITNFKFSAPRFRTEGCFPYPAREPLTHPSSASDHFPFLSRPPPPL